MTSLVKIQFFTNFELLFGRVFFDIWKMLHQYFILNTPETIFWYVQGAKVEFITPNSTSAPCIYQKTTQIGRKWGILKKKKFQKEIFKKNFY